MYLRAAFVFKLAACLVIDRDENDANAVGRAPFMRSIWTREVLHGVLAERGAPRASLVGDASGAGNLASMENNNYWVHDPSDTPTGPEHGWAYIESTYKSHVHIIEKGEKGHGIECSDSGTVVHVGNHHVDNRKLGSGSVLLIEGCATKAQARDRFVDLAQVLHRDESFTTFSAHPKSLADLGHLVDKQRVAFHVPVPGNKVVTSLEDAYAEFHSSGLRTRKEHIHRIKAATYKPVGAGFDLSANSAAITPDTDKTPWGLKWGVKDSFSKGFQMNVDTVLTTEATLSGSYEVNASIGTQIVGECVYKEDEIKGFLAYLKGTIDTYAHASLEATIHGKFTVPLMPKGMAALIPIFASIVNVYVKLGWDLDLVVEMEGKATAEVTSKGKGEVNIGAYYNTAEPIGAKPIHTGKFQLEPSPIEAKAELAGKAAIVLDVMFGAEASTWGLATAGIMLSLTLEPGVFLEIKSCPDKLAFSQDLSLDVRCGADFKTTWGVLWSLRTGEQSLYATQMSTCTTMCFGPCVRELKSTACPPPNWSEWFMAYVAAGQAAFEKLKQSFKEIAVQAFCDEETVTALSWDGKTFSASGAEAKKYTCSADQIPKELPDIVKEDFVFYKMVNLIKL
jgi:hypothetical protein